MNRLMQAIKTDAKVQFRNNLYHVGIIISVLIAAVVAGLVAPSQMVNVIPAMILLIIGGTTMLYVAGMVIFVFALTGQFLFSVLGITLPAFQIAGGVLLFAIAFEMLRSPDAPVRLSPAERDIAREKEDIAITPLAVPLLCGPGAISTIIILQTQAETFTHTLILLGSVPVVYLGCYLVLRLSVTGAGWLNPLVLRILRRLMGLLFAAIAVQFIVNGIAELPFVSAAPTR